MHRKLLDDELMHSGDLRRLRSEELVYDAAGMDL